MRRSIVRIAAAFAAILWGGHLSRVSAQSRLLYHSVPITHLRGEAVTQPNLLSFPTALAVVGSRLVVLDATGDSLVVVVDKHTGRLTTRFSRLGRDSGNLWSGVSIDPLGTGSFSVLDGALARIHLYDPGPAGNDSHQGARTSPNESFTWIHQLRSVLCT
jgi:hypothetical protein